MLDVGIIREEDTGAFFVKVRHVTTPHTVTDRATPGGVESANLTGREGFFSPRLVGDIRGCGERS